MKKNAIITVLLIGALITGCSKEEPKIQYVSQESFNELQQNYLDLASKEENLSILIPEFEERLNTYASSVNSIRSEIASLKSNYKPLEISKSHTETDIKAINESLDKISAQLKLLKEKKEVNNKKNRNTATTVKTKPKSKVQRKKYITPSLSISVSNVNKWGANYVAVIYSNKNGYRTVAEKEAVGGGWGVLNIEQHNVTFVHTSGKIESVRL